MPISGQKINSITIDKLKSLRSLGPVELGERRLTAITGANGAGKSTILHALACSFRPETGNPTPNYRFPEFFLPTSDERWNKSRFSIKHQYRDEHGDEQHVCTVYEKGQRWTPKYDRRPVRAVDFVGVRTCIPRIEEETAQTFRELATTELTDEHWVRVRTILSAVMNRTYAGLSEKVHAGGRRYRGASLNGLSYSSLSMGAGEQRVIDIVSRMLTLPKYGLLLVDEIDLLLHQDALDRLLDELGKIAESRKQQVVFTTHRESVLARTDVLNVVHIHQTPERTLFLNRTTPDALHRLTGKPIRSVEIFVEDELARAIVERVAEELKIVRHVEIIMVGAAQNLFTVLGSAVLKAENLSSTAFLLDGDVYCTDHERDGAMKKVVTGTEPNRVQQRQEALTHLLQLQLPPNHSPEQALHELVAGLTEQDYPHHSEVIACIANIGGTADAHDWVMSAVKHLGYARPQGLKQIVNAASCAPGWAGLTADVRQWMQDRKSELHL